MALVIERIDNPGLRLDVPFAKNRLDLICNPDHLTQCHGYTATVKFVGIECGGRPVGHHAPIAIHQSDYGFGKRPTYTVKIDVNPVGEGVSNFGFEVA